ncbi:uncharacterized protein ACA1_069180 [Acanthamoeba castellanii str. Neff]|uniref:Uncharacterized protein n=1 Tax=Acanthamoeba castellanii (strain ATCC 30010 / Neff) TaxID=1257118 RepID=L8HCR1_ACACF|nr:uncharacterized protein ACA1_069180 [Acanthamoeba castellanii str. Neff]ELR23334.1 hypothetical protein ACA1_069180 [Acanthamoeba castellanii str. Neff]
MDSEVERKLYAMLITSYCVDSSVPISPACPSPTPAVAHYHGPLIAPVADRSVVFPPLYSRFCADLRHTDSILQRSPAGNDTSAGIHTSPLLSDGN